MAKWWIIILVIILLIAGVVIGYFIWDNSESVIRGRIQESYSAEMSYEICDLNDYSAFKTKENCYNFVECMSKEISLLVPKERLKEINKEIKADRSVEVLVSQSVAGLGNSEEIKTKCLV